MSIKTIVLMQTISPYNIAIYFTSSEGDECLLSDIQWRKPGAEFGGMETIFADQDDVFSEKFHFSGKNFWWPFFSHQPGFSNFPSLLPDFPFLYSVYDPFLTRKTPLFTLFILSRTTLLLKILGRTNAWAVPHLKLWGGDRSPSPLLGFSPCAY